MMPLSKCRMWLAALWLVGFGFLLTLMIATTFENMYKDPSEAWAWFLPTTLPTVLLIAGVVAANAFNDSGADRQATAMAFWCAFGMSALYLSLVAVPFLVQLWMDGVLLQRMKQSGLWLGPLQGVTAALLGIFFTGAREKEEKPTPPDHD